MSGMLSYASTLSRIGNSNLMRLGGVFIGRHVDLICKNIIAKSV